MAEWLVEAGIAEERAIRLAGDAIAEARTAWPGRLTAGEVAEAVLVARSTGSTRGTARFAGGELALVDRLPREASEGATLRLAVTRPAIAEQGRGKLAQARPTAAPLRPAPLLAEALRDQGHTVRMVRCFPAGDWDGLVSDALAGAVEFAGGTLQFSPTPAMLLVDIDGTLAPRALALAAAAPLATALRRFDVGGAVGIDFPTLPDKADRRAVDAALAEALDDWPHERTAMNGFGFVQLVARLERPSLLHRATFYRAGLAWRAALRRAEMLEGPGDIELSLNPALRAAAAPADLDELARRTGRAVRLRDDPGVALEAPHAQLVPR